MHRLISDWFRLRRCQRVDLEQSLATVRVVSECNARLTFGQWPGIVNAGIGDAPKSTADVVPLPVFKPKPCKYDHLQGLGLMVCSCAEYGDLDHK